MFSQYQNLRDGMAKLVARPFTKKRFGFKFRHIHQKSEMGDISKRAGNTPL
jgi:hypothetical protein